MGFLLLAALASTGCETLRQYQAFCRENPEQCAEMEQQAKEELRQSQRDRYYRNHQYCGCDDD